MKRMFLALGILLLVAPAEAGEKPAGITAGWNRQQGIVLLGELNCVSCHAPGAAGAQLLPRQAPILAEVGSRVTPQYLRAFLDDPQKLKAGTPMPDLLHGLAAQEKSTTIEALVHFLVSRGGPLKQHGVSSRMQIDRGNMLYHSVGCVACHQPFAPAPRLKKDPGLPENEDSAKVQRPESASIPLGDLASKTTIAALAKFLGDPLHVRPSGRMPSLNLTAEETQAIACYLVRDQVDESVKLTAPGLEYGLHEGKWTKVDDFTALRPTREGVANYFSGNVLPPKKGKKVALSFGLRYRGLIAVPENGLYRFWVRSNNGSVLRIDNKVVVDSDGRHGMVEKDGQFELTKGTHRFEIGYFQTGNYDLNVSWQPPGKTKGGIPGNIFSHDLLALIPKRAEEFKVDGKKAEKGGQLFTSLGCASCHALTRPADEKVARLKAPPLLQLDGKAPGGCLSATVAAGRPRFAFSVPQRDALVKAVASLKELKALDAKTRVDQQLATFGCYACHQRGGKGGPDRPRADYFTYEVPVDLGDEGRLPPPLDGVGAKLTALGFEDTLFSGKRYRSYMATRMPNFGKTNLGQLPELFDKVDSAIFAGHTPGFSKQLVDDGRKMVGKTMLTCINCHAWGELRLSGAEGLDLQQITRRIKPAWFQAWLLNPTKMRPGTRMPTAWPDGKSFYPDLQGGDTHKQIDAIWAYLVAGETGGVPAGLASNENALLVPEGEPIVFRTFLDRVSAYSILVGFPQRVHLAFDANRVRMVNAWTGDFVSTRAAWEGRGGEYAPIPSQNVMWLPEGPTFAKLDSLTAPWPKDVPRAKFGVDRTPPGWRFKGYRLSDQRVPTFLYDIGAARVEETPGIELRPQGSFLKRIFRLTGEQETPELYLRVAVGSKIIENDTGFLVDGKALYRIQGEGVQPMVRDVENKQELLVPIRLKGGAAKVVVEMHW